LADDEMIGAGVTLGADHGDDLAAAGVERIRDPNLNRRTPGSMTLVRPTVASTSPQSSRSRGRASAAARAAASSTSSTW